MGLRERMVVAHDLPMRLTDAAEELHKLGDGWYFVRDPETQIEELLAFGKLYIERETPGRVYVHLERPGTEPMLTAVGTDTTSALAALYAKLEQT